MLHTKFQGSPKIVEKNDFLKEFYHIWAQLPLCSRDQDHLNRLFSLAHDRLNVKHGLNQHTGCRGDDI